MTSSLIPACNGGLLRQPVSRLLQFSRRKKLYWRAADSRSGKSERESLPTWFSDDGDLVNLAAVRDHEVEIIPPICAALPTLKVSRMTSKRGFNPMLILRARAFCSAPIRIVSKCR